MESRREKGLKFSRRVFVLRSTGCALSAILVLASIYPLGAHPLTLTLWGVNAFVWPIIAYTRASRAADPIRVERVNLLCDSLFGGAWVSAMHFADAPSAVLISMLLMHNASVGGARLMLQGAVVIGLGVAIAGMLTGFRMSLATDVSQVAACFPMLMFYPSVVGLSSHKLARRLSQSKRAIRDMSGQDELTQLKNRHLWMKAFTESFESIQRGGMKVACVAIIDVDEFKYVNDTYGHLRGDAFLRGLGGILREHQSDLVSAGRYGGDEFCMLFNRQALSSVCQRLEAIRGSFLLHACRDGDTVPVTLSIGVAEFDATFETPSDWLAAADAALYSAKRSGRNTVAVWDPDTRQANQSGDEVNRTHAQ
ncbi:GGDEF domain-containing protein [Pandoraea anhela]|uniref:diguanylate cyclase n=2 Tax=Pandoraea anhela TaxID=2508295 RepID=A0A5E4Z2H6_9BURK|nr:GGDEF domain-containing protein [Pandoraea anhela]